MKKSNLLIAVLGATALLACSPSGEPSSASGESASTSSPSLSSSETDPQLKKALDNLKLGYNAIASFRGSYVSGSELESQAFTRQQILKSHEFFAERDIELNDDGELTEASKATRFSIVKADEEGENYAMALSNANEAVPDHEDPDHAGSRFDPIYANPFAYLDEDDCLQNGSSYAIPEGQARLIAEHFGVNIDPYVERPFGHANLFLEGDSFSSFSFQYDRVRKSGNLVQFSLTLDFLATGDIDEPSIDPIEDDGSDKTALSSAIEKVSGDNFTLTVTLTPGVLMMTSPFKYRFYFDGTRIFAYTNLYYSTPSLGRGDFLFLPSSNGNMTLNAYDYTNNVFVAQEGSRDPYAEQKPSIDKISMSLLSNDEGTYKANLGGGNNSSLVHEALFNSFIPQILHNDSMKYSANGLSIAIDDNGYPSITETFFYDMSGDGTFGENETLTITYSDVGTTVLPSEVTALLGE